MLKRLIPIVLPVLLAVQAMAYETYAMAIPNTPGFDINAKAVILMEAQSGRVLFAKDANARLPMASTTKIMTSLIALEQPVLDEYFQVDTAAIHVGGTTMGLQTGDMATLRGLVHGMMLPSGNDAANATAVHIGGSIEEFIPMMNLRAKEIGMEDTNFVTPSGLDEERHYSSAYDMALLTREAMKNPEFARISGLQKAKLSFGNPPYERWLKNTNKILERYPYATGVKTGYTAAAYRCLVTSAQKDGVELIAVTLNCKEDFYVHQKLYETYFERLSANDIEDSLDLPLVTVVGSQKEELPLVLQKPAQAVLYEEDKEQLETVINLPKFVYAPVREGDLLGDVSIYSGGDLVFESAILAGDDADYLHIEGFWERLMKRKK